MSVKFKYILFPIAERPSCELRCCRRPTGKSSSHPAHCRSLQGSEGIDLFDLNATSTRERGDWLMQRVCVWCVHRWMSHSCSCTCTLRPSGCTWTGWKLLKETWVCPSRQTRGPSPTSSTYLASSESLFTRCVLRALTHFHPFWNKIRKSILIHIKPIVSAKFDQCNESFNLFKIVPEHGSLFHRCFILCLQINEEAPQTMAPSLPVVSNSFDALFFSVEISEKLQVFCISSKRILRHFHRKSRCPRAWRDVNNCLWNHFTSGRMDESSVVLVDYLKMAGSVWRTGSYCESPRSSSELARKMNRKVLVKLRKLSNLYFFRSKVLFPRRILNTESKSSTVFIFFMIKYQQKHNSLYK